MAETRQKVKQSARTSARWRLPLWLLFGWLLIFLLYPVLFHGSERLPIPYSQFKRQVREGNVASLTVKGSEITGSFEKAYTPSEKKNEKGNKEGSKNDRQESYKLFQTVKPPFEDADLMPLLEEKNITLTAEPKDGSWLSLLLLMGLPWLLLIGFFIFRGRQLGKQMQGTGGIFGVGKSRGRRYTKSAAGITFEDVAGMENAKKDLLEIIEYLRNPSRFTALGADIPRGILLMGPPGCGKTMLARATAGEANAPFFSTSGSEFIEMLVGVGASRVRNLFRNAKKETPSIIFIDELDSVGRARGTGIGGGHDEREQTLNQILSEMDGFEPHVSVVVLAATNRPDVLDPALTRPGRFDRRIVVELPHKESRLKILRIHAAAVPLTKSVDLENIAARTVGFSGADIRNLVNEAALLAGRKKRKRVDMDDFEEARDKIQLGAVREEKIEEDDKKIVAYHESGHTLVARLMPGTDALQKVTIIPRGQALGATEQIPDTERHNLSRNYLLSRIAVLLGGRAAEKLVFDDWTSGAANDLKTATRLVREMVCQWGMSEKLGPVHYPVGESHPFLGREMAQVHNFSEYTAKRIDEEIQNIITAAENRAMDLLRQERERLDKLAGALLEKEVLEAREIEDVLDFKSNPANDQNARSVS